MEIAINAEKFFERLEHLQTHWNTHKSTVWGGSDAICIPLGAATEDLHYSKSSSMHLYLLGYEFPDSIMLITRNSFHFMATSKKCAHLEKALLDPAFSSRPTSVHLITKEKDEGMNRENLNNLINIVRKNGKRLGCLYKGDYNGAFIPQWIEVIQQSQIEQFEIAPSLGLFFAKKDETELVCEQIYCASSISIFFLLI
jgi:nucleosome binding factor SPN SPT16 subunit